MKRIPEPSGTFLDQEKAARDAAVMHLNARLSDKWEREAMGVLPKVNFSRLVRANKERMRWDHPEQVFEAAGVEPVRMNSEAVRAFIARQPTPLLAGLYQALFVDSIQFVPWAEFIDRFLRVVTETVAAVTQQRESGRPRRLTLLALPSKGVAKSNAWLVGFAWPWLARVVDYVVSDWKAVDKLVDALCDPSFEIDVLYVDDMIYSGLQAQGILFGLEMKSAPRLHVHLVVPFIATKGSGWLTRFAKAHKVAGLSIAPSTTIVKPYRETVRGTIKQIRRDHRADLLPSVESMLLALLEEERPAIVLEHKLADSESVPEFLSVPYIYAPVPLVAEVPEGSEFYKSPAMRWRMYRKATGEEVVRDFSTIDARLFAALLAAPYSHIY
jgi:hypothetical protein